MSAGVRIQLSMNDEGRRAKPAFVLRRWSCVWVGHPYWKSIVARAGSVPGWFSCPAARSADHPQCVLPVGYGRRVGLGDRALEDGRACRRNATAVRLDRDTERVVVRQRLADLHQN